MLSKIPTLDPYDWPVSSVCDLNSISVTVVLSVYNSRWYYMVLMTDFTIIKTLLNDLFQTDELTSVPVLFH